VPHADPDGRAPRRRENHPGEELAAAHKALRLTRSLDDRAVRGSDAGGQRWVLEGRLISVALQALRLGTSVVLDYGLWGRDERSALPGWPLGRGSMPGGLPDRGKDVQLAPSHTARKRHRTRHSDDRG